MEAAGAKNGASILEMDESELLAQLERAEKKENIAPKNFNALPNTNITNKKRKFDSISQEEASSPVPKLVDNAPDNFTRRIVEARNKKLLQAKQKQIVRSVDFFEPLNAEEATHKAKKRRTLDEPAVIAEDIEEHSQLRMRDRKITASDLKTCTNGRKFFKLGNLAAIYSAAVDQRQEMDDIMTSDWITIGVVITISDTKKAKNKSEFCIMKLNDLMGHEASLFLFGESFKHHRKVKPGTVIGVLNAAFLTSKEKQSFALKLGDEYNRLAVIGTSEDLSYCPEMTAKGKPCGTVYNKSTANRCDFHLQEAFNKERSTRMEFNDLYSTPLPKAERERHKQAHFNLSKGTFEIGNTQIGIDVPEEIKAKNTPSKSKLSIESKEVNEALKNTQAGSRYIKKVLGIPTDDEIQREKDKEKLRGVKRAPKKIEVEEAGDDDLEMSLDDSDSDELVIMHDEEEEPTINSEGQIASAPVEISADNINEEKQEPVEEIKVAYQCTECQKTSDKVCNKVGHHITIVRAE